MLIRRIARIAQRKPYADVLAAWFAVWAFGGLALTGSYVVFWACVVLANVFQWRGKNLEAQRVQLKQRIPDLERELGLRETH